MQQRPDDDMRPERHHEILSGLTVSGVDSAAGVSVFQREDGTVPRVALDGKVAVGVLAELTELGLQRALATSTASGEPLIDRKPLKNATDLALDGGRSVVRFLPDRGGSQIRSEGVLYQVALPGSPRVYSLRVRARPYTNHHYILAYFGPQHLHREHLEVSLRVLNGLGPGYAGFCNVTAPTHNRQHVQLFGPDDPPIPLWSNLRAGKVRVGDPRPTGVEEVTVGTLIGWPVRGPVPVFRSPHPDRLAEAVFECIDAERSMHPQLVSDVLFFCDRTNLIVALVARNRDQVRPSMLFPGFSTGYGVFGGLELSGLIVGVHDGSLFEAMSRSPEVAGTSLASALAEVTAERIAWWG